jgi:benzodiazapine receptor
MPFELIVQVKMHGLNTPFSTTWFLGPYVAWLAYGESSRSRLCILVNDVATYLNAGFVWNNR